MSLLLPLPLLVDGCGYSKRTSFDLATDVPRLSGVSGPSHDNEQRVLVGIQVEVCGAPRLLLPDLPLRHPAARHVGQLTVGMWCHSNRERKGRKGGGMGGGGREGATGRRGLLDKRLLTRSDVSCCAGMWPHISGRDGGRWIIDNTRPTDGIDWMLLLLPPSVSVICIGKKSPTSARLSNLRFVYDAKDVCKS